jgi:hypothetical protein
MTFRKHSLRSVTNQDGAAILDVDAGTITTLNATGGYVWQGLQRGESLEEIVTSLARETGQESLAIEQDIHAFVANLRNSHLLSD